MNPSDSGYVIERSKVDVIKWEDCDGNPIQPALQSSGWLWTMNPFGPGVQAYGGQDIWTSFVDTSVGSYGQGMPAPCMKAEIEISWAFRYYSGDPYGEGLIDKFNYPLNADDTFFNYDGRANEMDHKFHTNSDPLNPGMFSGMQQQEGYKMKVSWDWCNPLNRWREKIDKSPDNWPTYDRP